MTESTTSSSSSAGGDNPRATVSSSRRSSAAKWAIGFWTTTIITMVVVVALCLTPRRILIDARSATDLRRVGANAFEARFHAPLPPGSVVRHFDRQLEAVPSAVEVENSRGVYWIDAPAGIVRWSLPLDSGRPDDEIPMACVQTPGWLPASLGEFWLALILPATVMALCGFRASAAVGREGVESTAKTRGWKEIALREPFGFATPSPLAWRIFLFAAVAAALTLGLVPGWNRLVTGPDSLSYIENRPIRTPLVPAWIALFDANRSESRLESVPDGHPEVNHWAATHRYGNVVRAWKVLFIFSVCVFVWQLTSIVPWWFAGAIFLAAAGFDGDNSGMRHLLDEVLSEPLSYVLMFLALSTLCAYLRRPSWAWGLTMAAIINAIILARPASLMFASLFACVGLLHWRKEGLGFATRRAVLLALFTATGILAHCSVNKMRDGHFKQHAFNGLNWMTTSLQLAEPEDADAFSDPKLRQFIEICTVDYAAHRHPQYDNSVGNDNCWRIATPVFAKVYGSTIRQEPYLADEVLSTVARRLITLHPRHFAAIAWSNWRNGFWTTLLHLPLLLQAFAAFRVFRRTGDWRYLFVGFIAILPFICIFPACLTNYPISRYRSMTRFLEIWTPFLFLGMLLSSRLGQSTPSTTPRVRRNDGCDSQSLAVAA